MDATVHYLFPKVAHTHAHILFGPRDKDQEPKEEQEFDENREPVEQWFDEDGIPIQLD